MSSLIQPAVPSAPDIVSRLSARDKLCLVLGLKAVGHKDPLKVLAEVRRWYTYTRNRLGGDINLNIYKEELDRSHWFCLALLIVEGTEIIRFEMAAIICQIELREIRGYKQLAEFVYKYQNLLPR